MAVNAPHPCTICGAVVVESFQYARRPTAVGDHFLWSFRRCGEQSEYLLNGAIRLSVGGLDLAEEKRFALLNVQMALASYSYSRSSGGAAPIQHGDVFLTGWTLKAAPHELEADIRTDLERRLPASATGVQLTGLKLHQTVEATAHKAMLSVLNGRGLHTASHRPGNDGDGHAPSGIPHHGP